MINQNSLVTLDIPKLMEAQQTVRNADEAKAYLARLELLHGILEGALAKMQRDKKLGEIPPDFIIQKARAVVHALSAAPAADNVLVTSFASKLKAANVADADADASRAKALSVVDNGVLPAYRRISAYLAQIEASAPHDTGLSRLPNGAALYKAMIRHMTDSDLDPEAVHQTGLNEVTRISGEMDTLLRAQGYTQGSVGARVAGMAAEPRFVQTCVRGLPTRP